MNICAHLCVEMCFHLSGRLLWVVLLGCIINLCFKFLQTTKKCFQMAVLFYILTISASRFQLLNFLTNNWTLLFYSFFFGCGGTVRASHLLGRCSATWDIPSARLASVSFGRGSLAFARSQPRLGSSYFYCVLGMKGCVPPHTAISWDGGLLTFCLGWPKTVILLISTSWVAGITDVSHHARPVQFYDYSDTSLWF
jgi:hypothetical protein